MHSDNAPANRFALSGRTVWVAGHSGLVGQAVVRRLGREDCRILTCDRQQVDLRRQAEAEEWIFSHRPDAVVLAAATVGGILANSTRPAEFIYDNLVIATNVVEACRRAGVSKLLVLGSSCIYPRETSQPISEEMLLSGPLEPTNEWYAVAKIAALKLAQACRRQYGMDCISAMPTNLYGPGDSFDLQSAHVVPALIHKTYGAVQSGAAEIEIWGSGQVRREFLHVDDCADALVHLLGNWSAEEPVNIGTGSDITIARLAEMIAEVAGFKGRFVYDRSRPDGTPQKLLDVSRLHSTGWRHRIDLIEGLRETWQWYVSSGQND